ncbi:hypothetical protein HNQ71_006496 [Mesorhizobium sangaii]|uniref:Uncharacterized protein n=1 Tax=Mesorhizobium sangaii TaxID=505389 RepID=A0A841PF10_9HYPH|nr:hypothetical protein [Mesorhizobium sangaii]
MPELKKVIVGYIAAIRATVFVRICNQPLSKRIDQWMSVQPSLFKPASLSKS